MAAGGEAAAGIVSLCCAKVVLLVNEFSLARTQHARHVFEVATADIIRRSVPGLWLLIVRNSSEEGRQCTVCLCYQKKGEQKHFGRRLLTTG
jgi:hypothetical protein